MHPVSEEKEERIRRPIDDKSGSGETSVTGGLYERQLRILFTSCRDKAEWVRQTCKLAIGPAV